MTLQAVPAILTGQVHDSERPPVTGVYPHSLFTLLGGVYDIHASEPITGLCPVSECPVADGSPLRELFRDAREVWEQQMQDVPTVEHFIPGAFEDRFGRFAAWVDAQDFSRGDRPDAFVAHTLLPHDPWSYLPDGTGYASTPEPRGLFAYTWGETGAGVGRQRHMLQMQTADGLLGRVMDELRAAGTFDDALVVVTADHGYAFEPDSSMRGVTEDNLADILWTPLIVKSPRQRAGTVDDRNVLTVDIVPTIADELGVDPPWDDLDGVPAASADRDPADKSIADWGWSTLRADDHGPLAVDGEAGFARVLEADAVAGVGPLALWDRTGQAHGELVGRKVDELARGEPRPEVVALPDLDRWAHVDPAWPPLELAATAPVPPDLSLAVAVDGTVAAVVPSEPTPYGVASVHAMLWPGAVAAGDNEIAVYAVGGTPGEPVLHQLGVEAGTPG
ncbi:MAG TPA: sulfatase-like hydrolase/transferase [Acidimicrobiales bacterium]